VDLRPRARDGSTLLGLAKDPQVILTALCGIALVLSLFGLHPWMPYGAVLFGAYFALKSAYESLRERSIDVNFLMVLAAIGAVIVGRVVDAAALLFLFSLSSTLESLTLARTRSAIEGLIRLRPDRAWRIDADGEEQVPVEELRIGDTIRIPPFEAIPTDGTVVQGSSAVDQSSMTGESIPVSKHDGDRLLAGTRNLDGALLMRVESTVGDSTLDKIVGLVQDAQQNKASGERISQWFGQRYTFFVLGVFVVSLLVRLGLQAPINEALYASLTLLVALSPCALVISTPATTLSALAWSARNGILVRGGEFIELAGKVDTVAVDKTGTLTTGVPRLFEICVCHGAAVVAGGHSGACADDTACWREGRTMTPEALDLLCAAAAAEQYASHPVAQAVMAAAREHRLHIPEASDHRASAGLGVSAVIDRETVHVGQKRYLDEQGIDMSPDFLHHLDELQGQGMTVALLHYRGTLAALGFMDAPREDAPQFLRDLRSLGVRRVVMVTGDTEQTAKTVAEHVGVDEYYTALLPDEKTAQIEELSRDGNVVMMVGDGINDAPSLAKASIGVAMGGLGSDIALNAADVVLMHDRLARVPDFIRLGRKTNAIIRANLIFAGGVIGVLTAASLLLHLPLPLAVVGHEGSTVLVILNGLRLLRGPGKAA
jgi:Zn2+/Cd2+-exporting ATPase